MLFLQLTRSSDLGGWKGNNAFEVFFLTCKSKGRIMDYFEMQIEVNKK